MSLNLATLKDPSKCLCLLSELSNLSVGVTAVQETHFTCAADCWVLEDDYVVLLVYSSCSLNADVNLVLADDGAGWLWLMLLLKVSSSRWLRFMHPVLLEKGFLFFGG